MDFTPREIVMAFDALDAGDLGLFLCNNKTRTIGAHITDVRIRAKHTVSSFCGYGSTVDAAITDLWRRATELDPTECLLICHGGQRRGVRWNGIAWRPVELPPAPESLPHPEETGR